MPFTNLKQAAHNVHLVLPPIPTTGLTAADVAALSVRVREVMVEALREISQPVPSEKAAPPQQATPATDSSPSQQEKQNDPLSALPSLTAVTEPASDITPPSPALPDSRSDSRASTYGSEDYSTMSSSRLEGSETGMETEEDEGMVLVDRPAP